MKKALLFFVSWILLSTALSFSQNKDSPGIIEENRLLNKIADSLTRAQIARDSLLLEKEISLPFKPDEEEEKPNEKQAAFDKIMKLQEKEEHTFRNRTLLLLGGLLVLILTMRRIINKQKKKKK